MRVRILLTPESGETLPFNYNHFLAGVLYRAFRAADIELAQSLHASQDIKLYTFSELKGGVPVSRGLRFNDSAWFYLSSPRERLMRTAVEGLLDFGSISIGSLSLRLEAMEVLKPPTFNGSSLRFRTLSPICVTTKKPVEGRLVQWDLYPKEPQFYTNIRRNLIRKYELLHGHTPENTDLILGTPTWTKPVRLRIKDTYHRASHMAFEAWGARELLELGYECGFGEKNSMGFGMVEVVG